MLAGAGRIPRSLLCSGAIPAEPPRLGLGLELEPSLALLDQDRKLVELAALLLRRRRCCASAGLLADLQQPLHSLLLP